MRAALRRWFWAGVLLLACAQPAAAHRLHLEATFEEGEIRLEVFFSDGTPPKGAEVWVERLEPSGPRELASGRTDGEGRYRFRPRQGGRYRLRVREPGLHRSSVEVEVPALATAAAPSSASSAAPDSSAPAAAQSDPPQRPPTPWARILLGFALIAGASWGLSRWQRSAEPPPNTELPA